MRHAWSLPSLTHQRANIAPYTLLTVSFFEENPDLLYDRSMRTTLHIEYFTVLSVSNDSATLVISSHVDSFTELSTEHELVSINY